MLQQLNASCPMAHNVRNIGGLQVIHSKRLVRGEICYAIIKSESVNFFVDVSAFDKKNVYVTL